MKSLSVDDSESFLCHYANITNQIQIVRIANVENWYYERVVFPGQRLLFKALQQSELEVYTGADQTMLLAQIPCEQLQVVPDEHVA
ncbi:MAG: DUF1830 domain-containing protein [Cyanothece sp. SIO1E1]|nr:DUF1830 domain-containing protein [Cyanothece sp. SIO1E1]